MGASNVAAAYAKYASKVPPLSMVLLTYMALVSKDADIQPWYGEGHGALAQSALGRTMPLQRADIKAVERAITPLLAAGAIVADRRASIRRDGHHTVRYRLQLAFTLDLDMPRVPGVTPPSHVPRIPGDDTQPAIDESLVDNPPVEDLEDPPRPPDSGPHVPRKTGSRPPDSVPTSPGNRGTEEVRGTRRSEIEEEVLTHPTQVTAACARPGCRNGFILDHNTDKIIKCDQPHHAKDATATPPTAPTGSATPDAAPPAEPNTSPQPNSPGIANRDSQHPSSTRTNGRPQPDQPPPSDQDPPSPPAPAATPPPPQTTATPAAGDPVWIATHRRHVTAHDVGLTPRAGPLPGFTICGRSMSTGHQLTAQQATEQHQATWCPQCWPTPKEQAA